jgi:hypothetical protein
MPKKAVHFYQADDPGLLPNPMPNAKTTKADDRIFYTIHKLINTHLSGPALTSITARFQSTLAHKIAEPDEIGPQWTEIEDLCGFLRAGVFEAAIRSMLGEYILALNPTFVSDFFTYDAGMRSLFLQMPRWLNPGIYRARDRMVENVMRWHEYAREKCDIGEVGEEIEWEAYWGSRISRERQRVFLGIKEMDERARAAEDVGLIWA